MGDRKEVRLVITAKNNLILAEMEARNIYTITELSERMGMSSSGSSIGNLVNMKLSARKADGEWRKAALDLSEFFQCMPEDLFTEEQQWGKLERNVSKAEVTFAEVQTLLTADDGNVTPDLIAQAKEFQNQLRNAMQGLTAREERIIRMRFGFYNDYEYTLDEIAQEFNLSKDRIHQLEARALRKLNHPSRNAGFSKAVMHWRRDSRGNLSHTIDGSVLNALHHVN